MPKTRSQTAKPIGIYGAYGGLNTGDDLIGYEIARKVKQSGRHCLLFGLRGHSERNQGEECQFHKGYNLRSGTILPILNLKSLSGVIIGGGEQILETRLPNPLTGHLARCWQLSVIANAFRKPICVFAVGVSKTISQVGRIMLRNIIKSSAYFSVRDHRSLERLACWFPSFRNRIKQVRDPVLAMETAPILARSRTPRILVFPCKDRDVKSDYLLALARVIRSLTERGHTVELMGTCARQGYDLSLMSKSPLARSSGFRWVNPERWTMQGLVEEIGTASCVVALRMHACIIAIAHRVPAISVSRSDKMHAICEIFPDLGTSSPEQLVEIDTHVQLIERHAHKYEKRQLLYPEIEEAIALYGEGINECVSSLEAKHPHAAK